MRELARLTAVSLFGLALWSAADAYPRSRVVLREFQRLNPCPANDARRGPCPGHQIDHRVPLCMGGSDTVDNLQWLTHYDHRIKTQRDVTQCRLKRRGGAKCLAHSAGPKSLDRPTSFARCADTSQSGRSCQTFR